MMKGTDLTKQCELMEELGGSCSECAGKAYCDKWKQMLKDLSQLEPKDMEALIDTMEALIHRPIYLKGEKYYEKTV